MRARLAAGARDHQTKRVSSCTIAEFPPPAFFPFEKFDCIRDPGKIGTGFALKDVLAIKPAQQDQDGPWDPTVGGRATVVCKAECLDFPL